MAQSELTPEQRVLMKEIARETAKETVKETINVFEARLKTEVIPHTVKETLRSTGHDVDNPLELQADNLWVREQRLKDQAIRQHKGKALVTAAIGIILIAIGAYIGVDLK